MTLCACMIAGTLGLGGCALTTPTRAEVEPERVQGVLTANDLVSEGTLTVAVDDSDAPQVMQGNEGNHTGYYIDVARAIAERQGLDITVVSSTDAEETLAEGEADLYIGEKAAGDDEEELVATSPILENACAVFGRVEGEAPTLSVDDLSGATVAVQSGSASQDALAKAGVDAELKTYSNVNQCFDALEAGEADYVACDATAGSYLARAYPGVEFVSTVSDATAFSIVFSSDAGNVSSQVTSTLEELLDQGIIDALHRQWYGRLPLSLSDALLEGVTLSEVGEDDTKESAGTGSNTSSSSESDASDGELAISGDLNALD
ncbi:MAG: transporter substrate-binding domain-containing protein [Coriobacteriaceae bacterium]|nr:transporter substrate-binding domain-containing protein [Coriobacteriaceae bacterium]